ncbi:MFS transporter [Pseudonocardia sp. HH130629-09]|uniref:MFS transporter n=1 Tax=Pseudonocardia sp. HH130629-09 TaxID=1641402 RepID=UPI0006CB0CE6|nr:MFS transporter [Pseudonocardia sp. HH130629-09]ALE85778.1 MFS transporter [Pseudonocardia sp. HH130629-09]
MTDTSTSTRPDRTAWGAVGVMALTSFVLILAEFLPPGLLTPMATTLGITEGQAGQAVSATAFIGLLVAPTIGALLPRVDRRALLTVLAAAAAVSNLLVAIAPSFVVLLAARLLLGAAIGGFWAMSLAVASRLSTPGRLGRSMMLVNTGTTLATVAGVPVAVYLGALAGWQAVFVGVAVLSALTALTIRTVLPPVAPDAADGLRPLVDTLRAPGMPRGLAGHVLTVLGHFAAFTYVRPALGTVPGLDAGGVAVLLAVFGAGGVVGNLVVGMLVDRYLRLVRYAVPLVLAAGVASVATFPAVLPVVVAGVAVWGLSFGAWLTVVSTWMARVVPDRMEAGGGLLVAGFQLGITVGAVVGGLLVDGVGVRVTLAAAAVVATVGGLAFGSAPQEPSRS